MSFAKDYTKALRGDSKQETMGHALSALTLGTAASGVAYALTKNPTAMFAAAALGTLALPVGAAVFMATERACKAIRHWANS
jgi:hypothetical protein